MKRRVRVWMLTCIDSAELWNRTFDRKMDALNEREEGQDVVLATITYDDGKAKPKQRKK